MTYRNDRPQNAVKAVEITDLPVIIFAGIRSKHDILIPFFQKMKITVPEPF